ncbi:putative PSP, proline-rich [Septoria linicola]|nr:putative PSP, proline-rich [Septoria linicola]
MPGVIVEDQPVAKARKPTKNEQRRAKKKQQKRDAPETPAASDTEIANRSETTEPAQPIAPPAHDPIQDVPAIESQDDLPIDDPLFSQFADIFAKFKEDDKEDPTVKEPEKPEVFYDDDDNIQDEDEEEETKKRLSKKARKAANKLSIAELKAIVRKPEIVEWTDTSAQDPRLLVNIKSARNVVPVPTHWSLKREYLSSKRGIEKPGFALPKFIAETGIAEMRDAVLEKQAEASLKQKARERVSGKTGKLDIDYQKLYEAFFRRQTKPSLTRYGEVYYEGKEFETNLRHLRPGELSEELKEALNMPPGAPPPWLINQQKIGPPPSYPALKISGLNAPPPPGAQWGFHPGGYGKPPVDDQNRPLFGGDVFGLSDLKDDKVKDAAVAEPVDKSLWGELQPPVDDEEEEEEEEDEEDEEEEDESGTRTGLETPYGGTETPGGFASTIPTDFPRGPDDVNLRKQRFGTETESSNHPRAAGTVLNERSIRAEGFFGGERAYDLSAGKPGPPPNVPVLGQEQRGSKRKAGDVDVSMDVEALVRDGKMSKEDLQQMYEAQRAEQSGWQGGSAGEDLSGLVAEESAKRQKRDRERAQRGKGRRVDIPPEDQYGTGRGQSYRPGNARERTPPARLGGDSYRARSPPRRNDFHDSYKADTYRAPRGRSRSPPPRRDDDRLPPRRDDDRLPPRRDDTFRRRSPSTAARFRDDRVPRGGDSYRGRPRSPLPARREDLPRDDLFRREPVRDDRDFRDSRDYRDERDSRPYVAPGRSPLPRYRDRSPLPLKRAREPSPISSRGRRSPPPAKRERLASPVRPRYDDYPPSRAASPPRRRFSPEPRDRRGYSPSVRGATRDYRLRSRSPLARNERGVDPRTVDNWRRPQPSPAPRQDYLSRDEPAINSGNTSRRSSPPPIHPSRLSHLPAEDRLPPSRASPRDPYDTREPYRAPEPEPPRDRITPQARDVSYSDRSYEREREVPPPREPRRDDDVPTPVRAPPTEPSSQRAPPTSMAPPTGPSAAVSAPSGPRASAAPPSGPRGAPAVRGDFAARGRGSFVGETAGRGTGSYRGGFRGRGGGFGRGGADAGFSRGGVDTGFGRGGGDMGYGAARSVSEQVFSPPTGPSAAISGQPPSGPRNSFSGGQPPAFPRQASASAANPYQRTQRFGNALNGNTDTIMSDIPTGPKGARRPTEPAIVTAPVANRIHPAIAELPKVVEGGQRAEPVVDRSKLKKLEEEADKLRRQLEEKETRNRRSMKDWDRGQREMEVAGLRSELAEQALRTLNGESEGQAAF